MEMNAHASHAELAMKAARRVARARKQSQKEKMGHVVCHHLLCLLAANDEHGREIPVRRRLPAVETLRKARLQPAREMDDAESPQISLGF